MKNSDNKTATITFPCAYPIKVIGKATPDFKTCVIDIVEQHIEETVDKTTITMRSSRNNLYYAVTLTITATGAKQLNTLHQALLASDRVKMVL